MHDIHRKFPVILGLRLSDAAPIIKSRGFTPRFHQSDDKKNDLGNTFMPMRINLSISKGIIVGYTFY